ncbi:hypothetical protein HN419_03480 [Candidatus Woesearchaeota archaeon]|nr:hypothetical protein [Candidatus Woesearchaeota archaeon]MBT3538061.1 hypothetical protein [Candidatus Woesearchaeota archaeon]MBT4697145.1 hypothetical protein [Candidatus Woesearchaeota archaeon]MBT4717136.1 hypothetical protein [Candidatus Woesearchaeota archaeon]MBT7105730.1 hypothetical protein [Candidatus Woesearchaeota archaeon]
MEDPELMLGLKDFGLNDKEAKVYLATLKLGSAKANDIAKEARILRETTYFVIKSLEEKGLMGHVIKSGTKYFEAANPEKLIEILEEKKFKVKRIKSRLDKIKEQVFEKPSVEFYEGVSGMKTVIDDLIKTKKKIQGFTATSSMFEELKYYYPNYIKRRADNNIKAEIITEKSSEAITSRMKDKEELRKTRFFPDKMRIKDSIYIYGQKVAIINPNNSKIGIIITDPAFSDSLRKIFGLVWDKAE